MLLILLAGMLFEVYSVEGLTGQAIKRMYLSDDRLNNDGGGGTPPSSCTLTNSPLTIDSAVLCRDATISPTNITVTNKGNLTLINVNLSVAGNITIYSGGNFTLKNSNYTLLNQTIYDYGFVNISNSTILFSSNNGNFTSGIYVQNNAVLTINQNSNITRHPGETKSKSVLSVNNTASFEMKDSHLSYMGNYIISVRNNLTKTGLRLRNSYANITNNTFDNNYVDISLSYANNTNISGNRFNTNNSSVAILSSTNNNLIIANNVVANDSYKTFFSGAGVSYSNITKNSARTSQNVVLFQEPFSSYNNIISDNYFSTTGDLASNYPIYALLSTNTLISKNTLEGGIYIHNGHVKEAYNIIDGNTIIIGNSTFYFGYTIVKNNLVLNGNLNDDSFSGTGHDIVYNNTLNSGMISIHGSFSNISHNTINYSSDGYYPGGLMIYGNYTNVSKNTITAIGESTHGLFVSDYLNYGEVSGNNVNVFGRGAAALYAANIRDSIFADNYFKNNAGPDIIFTRRNSIASSGFFLGLLPPYNNTFVNTTFNESNTLYYSDGIDLFGDDIQYSRQWYLDVYVNDSAGNALEDASVNIYDAIGTLTNSQTTGSNGSIMQVNAEQYIANGTWSTENISWATLLNISVAKAGYNPASMLYNLTANVIVNLTMTTENPSLMSAQRVRERIPVIE